MTSFGCLWDLSGDILVMACTNFDPCQEFAIREVTRSYFGLTELLFVVIISNQLGGQVLILSLGQSLAPNLLAVDYASLGLLLQ